jgi:hypothetical protein
MSIFERPGVFSTWGMVHGELPADKLVRRCVDYGAAWVAGQWYDDNIDNLEELADTCHGTGVAFGVWDSDPDAWRTSQIVRLAPAFYIAESEGYRPDWEGIILNLGGLEAAVVTNFEGLDDDLLQAAGFACLPECYRSDQPSLDPVTMRQMALDRGYQVAAPCLGAYGGYPLSGYPELGGGFNVWNAETMTAADWDELKRRSSSPPPPDPDDGGDDMTTLIGHQDGIQAAVNRLIALDPAGSKPNRDPSDINTWGAWDKLQRTLQILKDDHDEALR